MSLIPEQIVLYPIVTEKSEAGKQSHNQYTFAVSRTANKLEIRRAVERYFRVKVAKVAVMNVAGKPKRMGMYRGYRSDWKKAVVTLAVGQKIEMLERV
ncbi:MAG: 50S ribosomal protein L23 [candidate division WOR-3 bacterium]